MKPFHHLLLGILLYPLFSISLFEIIGYLQPDLADNLKISLTSSFLFLALFIHSFILFRRRERHFRKKYEKLAIMSRIFVNRFSELDPQKIRKIAEQFETIFDYDVKNDIEIDVEEKLLKEANIIDYLRDRIFTRVKEAILTVNDIPNQNRAGGKTAEAERAQEKIVMIREAVKENRIDMYLQPLVKLPHRKRVSYELFSRLTAADGKLLKPGEYIKICEEHRLVSVLDNYLLFRGIQILKHKKTDPSLSFFVNMSRHTFMDRNFMDQFIEFLAINKSIGERLFFEIAYQDFIETKETLVPLLKKMEQLGFKFALDQVPVEKFDVKSLKELNFQYVKLKITELRAMIKTDPDHQKWHQLKTAIHQNGAKIIAEHVETEEELVDANELGIEFGQGYFFGEPSLNYRRFDKESLQ